MSYLVLARKYRPRNFSEMVGQEHVVQALANALTQQRLHHAYLFTGTRGVGKTTVSRILAKSLNCVGADGSGGITATPCGVCEACTAIDAGRFVDYTELDAASNRGVDEVQGLLEQAVYKPVQGRFKVFMIDEVHMLTGHAFNAMLKTLEEPPEYLKFVLATTDPQKVPVTVLSRCLQFSLRPMAPEVIMQHLGHVLGAEQVSADVQAQRLLARAARGSMRDALSLTDQAIAFGSGRLEEAAVRQMLGSVDRSVVFRLIDALAAGDGKSVVETVEQLRAHGFLASTALEDMAQVLQRMAVHQAVPAMEADASDPEASETACLAKRLAPDETQLLYSLCIHGRAELGLAPDEYAGLTMVLLRFLPFKGDAQVALPADSEKKSLKTAEEPPRHALAPISAPQEADVPSLPAAAVAEPELGHKALSDDEAAQHWHSDDESQEPPATGSALIDPPPARPRSGAPLQSLPVRAATTSENSEKKDANASATSRLDASEIVAVSIRGETTDEERQASLPRVMGDGGTLRASTEGDFWHALVQTLIERESIGALVRELALQAQLVVRGERQWTLRVENESLGQSGARERLEAALAEAGHAVRLQVERGAVSDSPSRRNSIQAAARLQAAEALLHSDPFVQEMIRDFGAKIVAGSVKPL